ncbi:phosphatase PAP2 family protein [bacterium]|nr:phosphatase PAP2 family protein [bacterium]
MLYRPFIVVDEHLSAAVRAWSPSFLDPVARAVTHLGDAWVLTSATVVLVIVLFARRRPAEAALVGISVGGGALAGDILRGLVERARPGLEYARIPLPDSYSFPSGHALGTFLFFGVLFFIVALEARSFSTRAWVLALCVVLAVLVALSRVYLGVHYFGDVVASWIVGSGWLTLCAAGYFAWTSGDRPIQRITSRRPGE